MNNTNPFEDDNASYHVLMNSEGHTRYGPPSLPCPNISPVLNPNTSFASTAP